MKRIRVKALVWVLRDGPGGPEALLLRRPPARGGGWHPVTGKADRDEAPEAAAAREAREETGLGGPLLDLRWSHAFETPRGPMVEHSFLLRAARDARPRLSEEHVEFLWAPIDEARSKLEWDAHRRSLELAAHAWRAG